jgi:soluble lytic murein transglycosylase-like protein
MGSTPSAASGASSVSTAPAPGAGFVNKTPASLSLRGARQNAGIDQIISNAAYRHHVDPALVRAVINTESGGNSYAISRRGAVGLMQLIPSTAQRFGVMNSFDPAQNVEGGTMYLRSLLDRYNGDLTKSLAAYNAGERAVDLSNGVPAYRETRRYVQKVTDSYFQSDSGQDMALLNPFRPRVRQEVNEQGRIVYTNE